MPRRKDPEEKLSDLQRRKAQIDAQIQREQARKRERERKDDTRRKIIAGALALEHMNGAFRGELYRLVNEYVTRPNDRALFGLDPLPTQDDR